MRVLQVNKFFRPGAGAESAYFATRQLLADNGHDVIDFAMAAPENVDSPYAEHFAANRSYGDATQSLPGKVKDAAASIYSPEARRSLRGLLRQARPDVAHLHNVYHQLTLSIVDELKAHGIPTVMTLHDYKIVCPSYTLFTEGETCRRCVGGSPAHAVKHRCIKGSRAGSALAAAEATLARTRGSYRKLDALISPSRFLAELAAVEADRNRIHVVPNFLPVEDPQQPVPAAERRPVVFFAGRLEAVKGVVPLLEAFRSHVDAGVELVVAGDGPLRDTVEQAAALNPRVTFLGRIDRDEVDRWLRAAAVMAIPSLWEENCPMVVLEARVAGTPLLAPPTGGFPDLIDHGVDGLLVDSADPGKLGEAVTSLVRDVALRDRMAEAGQRRFVSNHGPRQHLEQLLAVYRSAGAVAAS